MVKQTQQRRASEKRLSSPDPMKILSAEHYNDGTTVSAAQSLTELARQSVGPAGYIFGLSEGLERTSPPDIPQAQPKRRKENGTRARRNRNGESVKDNGEEDKVERRRKKQKMSEDEEAEDEAAKKARGRPRLDTKDETAADRRRTQIRMAQRAYRHRKETTISSLEKQVEKLQSTTEEMNNVFISLYDFAVSKGLLQREPEFGQHLQSTTQRFLVLAKSAATDEQGHDEDPNHPEGKLGNNDADADCGREQQSQQQPSPEDEANTTMPSVIWGYQISKAESPENEYDLQQYYNQTHIPLNHLTEHQIISRTTPGNSGFSIDLSDSKIEQWRAEIPDMDAQYQFAAGLGSDYRSIRPPSSFAHSEASFARRLQRTANERGFLLITSPDANPKILKRVFGLSLRFHTKEDLADALKKAVSQCSTKEPLSNWRAPFVHLGGAGTYYPLAQDDVTSDLMPKLRTGRSMGPFTSTVMEGREKYMVDDFRSSATGFEGKYFDANDVEGYLRGKGIDIPPNTEYITVNLDMISLQDVASPPPVPTPVSLSAKGRNSISLSPKTPVSPNRGELSKSEQSSQASSIEALMGGMQGASGGLTTASGYIDPSIAALPGGFTDWMNASNTNLTSTNNKLSPDLNAFDLTGPVFNTGSIPQPSTPYDRYDSSASDNPRMVTFSVSTLVEYITRRGVCLGRAPGFRPQDVDLAIRRTIQDSF